MREVVITCSPSPGFARWSHHQPQRPSQFHQHQWLNSRLSNGQSVSYAVMMFPPGSVNPPHTHPRASELIFVANGSLEVGFVDTANKLYTQALQAGDVFVFPKGLVDLQFRKEDGSAAAISAFDSANAGTVSIPGTVFGSGIQDVVLAKPFETRYCYSSDDQGWSCTKGLIPSLIDLLTLFLEMVCMPYFLLIGFVSISIVLSINFKLSLIPGLFKDKGRAFCWYRRGL